ncbi:MAG: ATP-dependent Clp protease proteolytic subunit, partial [Pseudomonadota bacterium]|nr:ATP-dependent Clp protease proteolytic subunit [Pseudomonadota bacterium]
MKTESRRWFDIRASGSTAELLIYGDIGESWSDESITARDLVTALATITASELTVRVNSYGGSVSDGLAIYNALRRHPAVVAAVVEGVAVSIASLIVMAGDRIEMAENSLLMIHAPWGAASGNAADMREMADILDKFADAMTAAYARRLPEAEARRMLTDGADHWFTAEEALAAGLVDEITPELAIAASLPTRYRLPEHLNMTTEHKATETKPAGSKPDLQVAGGTEAGVLARIQARNDKITAMFGPMMAREEFRDILGPIQAQALADTTITPAEASRRAMAALGEGVEPLACIASIDPLTPNTSAYGLAQYGANRHVPEFQAAARDALLLRGGVPVNEPHPGARDVRGMSLLSIAESMIGHRGRTFTGDSPNAVIKAAMSTSDFPLLLADTAGKALMVGFENEPASHRIWTRETSARDFKPQKRVALSGAPGLEPILEGAEYESGALKEKGENFTLATYGKILSITRHALINDDLGGFTRVPQAFGAAGARLEADKVYALLTSNPLMADGVALFNAAHGNLVAVGSALNATTLGAARAMMRKQKGMNGGYLNPVPRFLIVPAALETTALVLIAQERMEIDEQAASGNSTTIVSDALQWIRDLIPVVDPRLDDDSATAWYLAAAPEQVDTFE